MKSMVNKDLRGKWLIFRRDFPLENQTGHKDRLFKTGETFQIIDAVGGCYLIRPVLNEPPIWISNTYVGIFDKDSLESLISNLRKEIRNVS